MKVIRAIQTSLHPRRSRRLAEGRHIGRLPSARALRRLAVAIAASIVVTGCAAATTGAVPDRLSGTAPAAPSVAAVDAPGTGGAPERAVPPAPARDREPAEDFAGCLAGLGARARAEGISGAAVDRVLSRAEWLDAVVALDRRQPEFVVPFHEYLARAVSPMRVATGRERRTAQATVLAEVEARYGVPAEVLVAFWGLETDFGRFLGRTDVASALATLACEGRRARLFTDELFALMRLVERDALPLDRAVGSWAGAMGHVQFMPSVYLRHAVDGDGSGRRDLFASIPDAMHSAGHFLQALGWVRGLRWGEEVVLPANFDWIELDRAPRRSADEWQALGVQTVSGRPLSAVGDDDLRLVVPSGHRGPVFLVGRNYDVILGWNRSEQYALAVGLLADRIAGEPGLLRPPPTDVPRLTREQVVALQQALNAGGFDAGVVDGLFGPATRAAVRRQQRALGLVPDGQPDARLLAALAIE